ncbi:MAG: PrsW family intramembrane metalloprotease [Blastocatellia bacterium]|nr:MAG: PrsW family intramembrane metalloprotease [Blastocatellia bacterium]
MYSPDPNINNPLYSNRAPTIVIKPTAQTNVIKVALGIIAALIALLLGLLVLLVIGIETGPVAFLIGLVTATIPVPFYVVLVLWLDRYESEPFWMLATAFFWGALIATFFAFLFNTITGAIVGSLASNENAGNVFAAVFAAPLFEETGKATILFVFYFWKKDEFDGVVDGIVYAALVGLGFAMTENIQYYGKAVLNGGGGELTLTFFVRGALAPFSHPFFTSMTGIGLGLARQSRNTAVKFICPVIGLLMAMSMHSIWNGSAALFGGIGFLLAYICIMCPAFIVVLVVLGLALRREGQIVREFLMPDLQGGLLTREEYTQLGSILGRMGSSFNALSQRGVRAWQTRRRFNQIASELAFHRSRVARGVCRSDQDVREIEYAYVYALKELIAQIRAR